MIFRPEMSVFDSKYYMFVCITHTIPICIEHFNSWSRTEAWQTQHASNHDRVLGRGSIILWISSRPGNYSGVRIRLVNKDELGRINKAEETLDWKVTSDKGKWALCTVMPTARSLNIRRMFSEHLSWPAPFVVMASFGAPSSWMAILVFPIL